MQILIKYERRYKRKGGGNVRKTGTKKIKGRRQDDNECGLVCLQLIMMVNLVQVPACVPQMLLFTASPEHALVLVSEFCFHDFIWRLGFLLQQARQRFFI